MKPINSHKIRRKPGLNCRNKTTSLLTDTNIFRLYCMKGQITDDTNVVIVK